MIPSAGRESAPASRSRFLWRPAFHAWSLAVVFVTVASFVSIHLLYDSYHAYALDLGLFTQSLKYTLEGQPLFHTVGGLSHLAYHFSPILFLLVPLYWLFPHAQTLLVVQALALGLSGCMVYYIARSFKFSHRTGLLVEGLFFISPLVWGLVFFDFHEVALAVPALFAIFIGMREKRWRLFACGLFLALITKEDIIVTLGVFAAVLLGFDYLRGRRLNRPAFVIFASALVAYGLAIIVSAMASQGESARMLTYFSVRYTYLKPPLWQAIEGAVSAVALSGSWVLVLAYLAPLGFLPLMSLTWVAPALFNLALNIFSTCPSQHVLQQSSTAALPFLFMAAFSAVDNIRRRGDYYMLQKARGQFLVVLICLLMIFISVWIVLRPDGGMSEVNWPNSHDKALNQLIALIPEGASVTANNSIFPHLVAHNDVYLPLFVDPFTPVDASAQWGFPDRDTEYVIIDSVYRQSSPEGFWEDMVAGQIEQKYRLVADIDGARLYQLR